MMNDRFAAQLRQHLVDTADERPADGQLAALDARVAVTAQRHPLAARLTWFPGRIGPFPSAALRYGLVVLALVAAAVAVGILAGGRESPASTVFEGTWTATDRVDRSTLILLVGGGSSPAVQFEDDFATGDACALDPVKVFTAAGTGEISGNQLATSYPDGGGCGFLTVNIAGIYEYDAGTDTLLDQDGVTWARVEGSNPPPTQRPAAEPPETRAPVPEATLGQSPADPTATPECVDLARGGTYTGPVGPLTVTATLPETPAIPWQGLPAVFEMSGRCGSVAPITLFASTAATVLATSCMPSSPEIASFADAVARLDTPAGDDISDRIDLSIGGHAAARYDISNLSTCPEGFGLWNGTTLGHGETGSLYVIDVDGVLMAIELNRDGTQTQAELEEAHAIIASLRLVQ